MQEGLNEEYLEMSVALGDAAVSFLDLFAENWRVSVLAIIAVHLYRPAETLTVSSSRMMTAKYLQLQAYFNGPAGIVRQLGRRTTQINLEGRRIDAFAA